MAIDTVRADIQSKLPDGEKDALYKVKDAIRANRDDLKDEKILKLDTQLEKYPKLKVCYWLKETFRDVYKQKTKYDAFQMYYAWECQIRVAKKEADKNGYHIKEMVGIQGMVNRLKAEVFAYFDGNYTNAFTERFNRDIKDLVRLGNGYRFDTLRAKVLYGTKATERSEWKNMNFTRMYNMMSMYGQKSNYAEEYELLTSSVVDIETICDLIEKGEIGV
jgi:transposase